MVPTNGNLSIRGILLPKHQQNLLLNLQLKQKQPEKQKLVK